MVSFVNSIYTFFGLNDKGFMFLYIMGITLLLGGVFNIRIILLLMTIWRNHLSDLKNSTLRLIAIILGLIVIMIPLSETVFAVANR